MPTGFNLRQRQPIREVLESDESDVIPCLALPEESSARWKPEHHRAADRNHLRKRGSWLDPSGYDAGKKIKGRKRHILVDTLEYPKPFDLPPNPARVSRSGYADMAPSDSRSVIWPANFRLT
jgi:hypothetical protein